MEFAFESSAAALVYKANLIIILISSAVFFLGLQPHLNEFEHFFYINYWKAQSIKTTIEPFNVHIWPKKTNMIVIIKVSLLKHSSQRQWSGRNMLYFYIT